MRNLERAGHRFVIGLGLVVFTVTVIGLLQMVGVIR
jgi:hypothetical protein